MTHFLSVDSNHAPQAPVVQMLNAHPLEGPPFASVDLVTPETHTPTVYLILAPAVPAAREPSARIMVVLLSVSVLPAMSVIHMFLADKTRVPALMPVAPTLIVQTVEAVPSASVDAAMSAVRTADPAAELTLVSQESVELVLSVRTSEADLCVNACLATREIPTRDVSRESVMRTLTVDHNVPARTTIVLIPALFHAAKVLTVMSRIMLLSAGVPAAQLVIHSAPAAGLPAKKSVLPAAAILTARLAKMTVLFVPVSQPILEILWWSVDMSVILTVSVAQLKLVTAENTDV